MHNYTHKKIAEAITNIDRIPPDASEFSEWIKADAHLTLLRQNAHSNEIVVHANADFTFIDSIVVPNELLAKMSHSDLTNWGFDSHNYIASYVYGGGKDEMWIERGVRRGYKGQQNGTQLAFLRRFEGWQGPGRDYVEINQEYTHLAEIHWRDERRAYCRYDKRGDLEPIVSVTLRGDKASNMTLVTFTWEALEGYLSVSNSALVRRSDFTLLHHGSFSGWSKEPPENIQESEEFFYHRKIMPGYAAYTSGIQIIRPRRSGNTVQKDIKDSWSGEKNKKYAEFIAHDWRNNRVVTISTDPAVTTNYFEAKNNKLPFELSPAFFRPEVLSKYKTDRDKYTLGEREITCRAAWSLRGYDVNEAGQIHAYICDLRKLPYEEQLHWFAHNEVPKASISERAFVNDFQGEFVHFSEPPAQLLSAIRRWHDRKVLWWTLRDEKLLDRINTPLTSSRDEWAEAFLELSKLVVEGFETTPIRKKLDEAQIAYDKEKDKTIALLEKLLNKGRKPDEVQTLTGLRTVQYLRTKLKGHVGGSDADTLAREAEAEHGSFANHFKHVCTLVLLDIRAIEDMKPPITVRRKDGCAGGKYPEQEIQAFVTVAAKGEEVDKDDIEKGARQAAALFWIENGGIPIAVAALKTPKASYKESVFRNAGVSDEHRLYSLELGYIYVEIAARGNKYGPTLVQRVMDEYGQHSIYATTRTDNRRMKEILQEHGFSALGGDYPSRRNKSRRLMLFVRP